MESGALAMPCFMERLPDPCACQQVLTDSLGHPVDCVLLEVNQAFEEMWGLSRDQLIGRRISRLFSDIPQISWDWLSSARAALSGESSSAQYFFPPAQKWYDITVFTYEPGRLAVIFHDITDLKQENQALQESQDWYSNLFKKAPIGIVFVDTQGNVIRSNSRALEIYGTHPQGPENNVVNVYQPPFDRASKALRICMGQKEVQIFEDYYPHPGKNSLYLRYRMNPKYDANGDITGIIISVEDITEGQRAQQKLQEAHRQLEQIIEHLPDATMIINEAGQIIFWNREMEKMSGVPKEQIIGQGDYAYAVPFYGKRRPVLIDRVLASDSQPLDQFDFIHAENGRQVGEIYVPRLYHGQGAYLLSSATKLYDIEGNTIGAIETIRDITKRKNLEIMLFLEKEQFKTTLLSIGDGFISTDPQGQVVLMNQIAELLTGWSQDQARGRPLEEVFHIINEFTGERCENPVQKVLETGSIVELANHTILLSRDGSRRPIEDSAAPIRDEGGQINGVVLVFRDFTARREKQARIEYLSYHDQTTGLFNRRYMEEEVKERKIFRELPLSVIMADVNGLKLTNDVFGHLMGDQVLQRAADLIKSECQDNAVVARIGGDEFLILLPQSGAEVAEDLVNRIQRRIADEKVDYIPLSLSFGWAARTHEDETFEQVYKLAEDKMYRHKLHESPSMRSNTLKTIIQTLHEKLPGEKQHSLRVSQICKQIGEELAYSSDRIAELQMVALVHDIGKIVVDDAVLHKPGQLNLVECEQMKRHSETGYRILSSVNDMAHLANYILAHHENWDGSGYPAGLKRDQIPVESRIIRIADAYDAMTSNRCYRDALSPEQAKEEIKNKMGICFDPYIAQVFLDKIADQL